ncbi:MAG TPA: hypothetical protein VF818_08845 [Ktedonobacterales bacterium]
MAPDQRTRDPAHILREALALVRDDRDHGASWLARTAARALGEAVAALLAGFPQRDGELAAVMGDLRLGARRLAHARPSMAALATTVAHIWAAGSGSLTADASASAPGDVRTALEGMRVEAGRLAALWDGASSAIAGHARALVLGQAVVTISRSGTVERVLTELATEQTPPRDVVVLESRPGGEGVALARALADAGWPVTLVSDAAMGLAVHDAGCVLLGADSVRADGSVVNKVGSYPLAVVARASGVPVYVLCETLKIAPAGWPLHLEEMPATEPLGEPEPGIRVRNVYFDRTPAEYITAVITEEGVLGPEQIAVRAATASGELATLDRE